MNYKSIISRSLSVAALALALATPTSCSDSNEPEARVPEVVKPSEQDPAAFAAYTAALRAWKATDHPIAIGILDNAPAVSTSERDFLRSLPDSLDFVAMRNPLSDFDRSDISQVRRDFATKILAYVDLDNPTATPDLSSELFDGLMIATASTPDQQQIASLTAQLRPGATLIFAGSPTQLSDDLRDCFNYFLVDISSATDSFDVQLAVRMALLYAPSSKLILATTPGSSLTDAGGVSRNSLAAAAVEALSFSPELAGIAIDHIGNDYYDPDIIYRRTRGAIQLLNPATK